MGKGDRRTRRGKLWRNSYGKSRNKKTNKAHEPAKIQKKNG